MQAKLVLPLFRDFEIKKLGLIKRMTLFHTLSLTNGNLLEKIHF